MSIAKSQSKYAVRYNSTGNVQVKYEMKRDSSTSDYWGVDYKRKESQVTVIIRPISRPFPNLVGLENLFKLSTGGKFENDKAQRDSNTTAG